MCDTESYIRNHIKRVWNKLLKLITALSIRLQEHDKSKLEEPEFSLWKKMDEEPRYPYGSKEYKEFGCPSEMRPYLLAILNSNLFFLYWTIVSDCWHITNKELSEFFVPTDGVCLDIFRILTSKLERKLERTKKYIGSVQTQYEYKHRECKTEIDAIDDALQDIYGLTDEEVAFLKEYKLKYRMSNGTI